MRFLMDSKRVAKDESEANKVIEYYKKYSLNPDLIKYFTGPEASCVEKRFSNFETKKDTNIPHVTTSSNVEVHDEDSNCIIETSCNSQDIVQSPPSLDVEINQIVELEETEEKNDSRSSSVASNKIEWDNGADIGYSNSYKLSTRKSASFPSVLTSNTSVNCNVLPTVAQDKSISENIQELRKMYHQLTFSSETSNSTNKNSNLSKEQSAESSSSLQENRNVKIYTQSSSSDNYLQKKIGDPIAYSTPHDGFSSNESQSKNSNNQEIRNSKESTSKSSNKYDGYTVTPMLTLPITKRKLKNDLYEQSMKKSDAIGHNQNLARKMDKYQKRINLCLTKPISVECISIASKASVHKDVQTSFSSDKSSKCVQTEELHLESVAFEREVVCTPLTQKIEYVKYSSQNSKSESDKSEANSYKFHEAVSESSVHNSDFSFDAKKLQTSNRVNLKEKTSRTTQTDFSMSSKIIDKDRKVDTKESIDKKGEIVKPSKRRKNIKYVDSSEVSSVNSSKPSSDDKTSTSTNIESQTEELLLTEMISLNHSKDLNTDIKRSIDILQKLLKSRKYDQATKKHYIKKIVQKIVNSKYSDDSTNSDLFRPKKAANKQKSVDRTEMQNCKDTSILMDNKPWYPVSEPIYTMPKMKSKKSTFNTKSEAMPSGKNLNLPTKSNKDLIDSNVIRNRTFILPVEKEAVEIPVNLVKVASFPPNYIPTVNSSTSKKTVDSDFEQKVMKPEKNENFTKETPRFTSIPSSRLAYSSSLDKENRPTSSDGKIDVTNWRTAKTLSEKLLENRESIQFRKGQGDYLLNVVKNERHHQLSWINNEIEHLVKLKGLLEKKPKSMKPESQLKEVIASLLKMKVDDMKGLPKNFEVLISESKETREKCNPNCDRMKEFQRSKGKSASLTPGYYTIETQLDPDGNLVDLTVYDGNGEKKYNYRSDGVVDDVSISSKNHNTEVKLRPKMVDYPGSHNVCRSCGRLFIPASDSNVSLCKECSEGISEQKLRTLKNMPSNYKICKTCGKIFVPSSENPNLCICKNCYEEELQPGQTTIASLNTEECEACGRLFVLQKDYSGLCLCKNCEKLLEQEERQSYQKIKSYKICRVCGEKFLVPKENAEQNICEECLQFVPQTKMKCACQKVTFSDPLELGSCRCVTKDLPDDENEPEWPLKNVSTKSIPEKSASEFCPDCGRHLSECKCGSKFLPKKPKLIGNENEDEEKWNISKGYPCAHCIGVQASMSAKTKTKHPILHSIHQSRKSKPGASDGLKLKHPIFFQENIPKYRFRPNKSRNSEASISQPSSSSQSSRESLKSTQRRTVLKSQIQAKKDKCCKACTKCVKFPSIPSPRPSTIRQRSVSSVQPPRGMMTHQAPGMDKDNANRVQIKKSCQCCTCTNCGIQTKKPGDKNIRCQCCVCENCGIQVTLDGHGRQPKIINSKWCHPKRLNVHTNKKIATDKLISKNRVFDKKKNSVIRKRDELDHTDESLQSISSDNIICITPTKYKNISNEKADSECQCVILNNRNRSDANQNKSLQIHPSVLKAICKSVNKIADTQERMHYMCPTNCPSGTSDPFVCIQIPQGIQCSDKDPDYEAKRTTKSFSPRICFFSSPSRDASPCPPCKPPPCLPLRKPPPCSPPCRPPTFSSPCRPPPCAPFYEPTPCTPFYKPLPCPPPFCPPPCLSSSRPPPCSPPCKPSPCSTPCRPPPCSPPCRPPPCSSPCRPPPCSPPYRPSPCSPPCRSPPCSTPCRPPPCSPPCRPPPCSPPCTPPPCSTPFIPPPCSPPCRSPSCSTSCKPPPCSPPCRPPPCSPPCTPPSCSPPCRSPPCSSPSTPPPYLTPCRPACSPPCTSPPCSTPCRPPPCSTPCRPPPCSTSCRPSSCAPSCRPPSYTPPCRAPPCLLPCEPPPCSPSCRPPSCLLPCPLSCPPLCRRTSCTQTCPPPCSPPPCRQTSCQTTCLPPPCRPCLSPCPPCPPPCALPCPSSSPPPCPSPCPPSCPPPCLSPCPVSYSPPPCPPPPCRPKILSMPFPLCLIPKHSCKTICCSPPPCCPSEYKPPCEPPSYCPSRYNVPEYFFQNKQPLSPPPGCQCKSTSKAVLPGDTQSNLIHMPCQLCGIPPCAALSSMSCPICNKFKQKFSATDSDQPKIETSRSESYNPLELPQTTKNNLMRSTTKSTCSYKSNLKGTHICKPYIDTTQKDNSSTKPDESSEDLVSTELSSFSSTPSRSIPPDESRSYETLDYPCKPLKPKMVDPRENSSEISLTCPSKKASCPAKPPPCPGSGNKPCPAYPPKPCRNLKEPVQDERTVNAEETSSETSLTCPSKKTSCPADPPPCPGVGNKPCPAYPAKPCPNVKESTRDGDFSKSKYAKPEKSNRPRKVCTNQNRKNSRYAEGEGTITQENEPILLPISFQSPSPLQEVQHRTNKTSRSRSSSKDLQTQDEVPSMSSNCPAKSSPMYTDNHQTNIQVYMSTAENPTKTKQNFSEPNKCSCSLETCKCSQTTTHEEKDIQCPAFKQCTCQTEPKEDVNVQCNCKAHTGITCKCGDKNQDNENLSARKKSSSSSSNSSSSSDTYMPCICCKKEKILKNLINKIPLCGPCQQVSQKNFYPHNYSNPLHSCLCYSLVNRDLLYQFKHTLTELERLDIYQQYCELLKNCKCCKKCGCKCKLPKKFKNGCAYFLKLEDACPNTHCEGEGTNSDSSNYKGEEYEENYLPEVTVKVPNCKGSCARKKENGKHTKKYVSCPSIQNYLCTMKPDFVERAERRRRILKDATSQREENSESRKLKFIEKISYLNQRKRNEKFSSETDIFRPCGYQTKAYCVFDIELNDSPKKVQPRIFKSFKEMKDLTRRKYLHLSEVKSKKNIHRERRLREANRLLANTFTRRLQKSTLKGAVDIPLNVKVVSY